MFRITRTPLRVSFFGGGTDYPAWFRKYGGAVISTSIDKYSYITCRHLPRFFDYTYLIKYSHIEKTRSIDEIEHPSVRECLRFLSVGKGVEIAYTSDVPALSGLGSSSAFTVGLLHALYALEGKTVGKLQLAQDAIEVEQERIKEHVGSQDQTIAAFGGFNKIVFGADNTISVTPVPIDPSAKELLENHLMLFFTGFARNASEIAALQIKKTEEKASELRSLARLVSEAEKILLRTPLSVADFGSLLHESWLIKRTLTPQITTAVIDGMYEAARRAGALGGKLLGAGGGGFLLLVVRPEDQDKVRERLKHLMHVPFQFESFGSQVIYDGSTPHL